MKPMNPLPVLKSTEHIYGLWNVGVRKKPQYVLEGSCPTQKDEITRVWRMSRCLLNVVVFLGQNKTLRAKDRGICFAQHIV
jgi:hypothetical protein